MSALTRRDQWSCIRQNLKLETNIMICCKTCRLSNVVCSSTSIYSLSIYILHNHGANTRRPTWQTSRPAVPLRRAIVGISPSGTIRTSDSETREKTTQTWTKICSNRVIPTSCPQPIYSHFSLGQNNTTFSASSDWSVGLKKGKGSFFYSAVSSPLDRSKRFTLFALPDKNLNTLAMLLDTMV